jgi:hypothetical protein
VQIVSSTRDTLPPGTVVRCSAKDVSSQGIRIQLDQQLPEGFLLELWIEISSHASKFFLAGEVKWCQELDEGKRYLIGIELKQGETEDFKLWQELLGDDDGAALGKVREA